MDVDAKVDELLSRRTFTSPEARERTRDALLKTLRPIEAIRSFADDETADTSSDDYKQDDGDGVTCTTIAALTSQQQERRRKLRSQASLFFTADDLAESNTAVAVAVAVADDQDDVNRKLKWGYRLLHFAAERGDEAECDRLIALGADIYAEDNGHKLPWQKAALRGHDALAAKLKP